MHWQKCVQIVFGMETEENGGNSVTAWHVQKLYRGDECKYYVLPYDLLQTIFALKGIERNQLNTNGYEEITA